MVAPIKPSSAAANSICMVSNITRSHPRRIYIDEIYDINKIYIQELRKWHDDIIYAYGTPKNEKDTCY